MSEKPPKTPWGKCDGCGKPAPLANLYPLEGEALCIDCYSAKPIPGEGGDGGGTRDQLPPLTPPSPDRAPEPGSYDMQEALHASSAYILSKALEGLKSAQRTHYETLLSFTPDEVRHAERCYANALGAHAWIDDNDLIALVEPVPIELWRRIVEVFRLYACHDSWGKDNQHRTAHRWTHQGAGWGPARRLLEEIDHE